jgi:hypothetical protein
MEAASLTEMSVTDYQSTRRHVRETFVFVSNAVKTSKLTSYPTCCYFRADCSYLICVYIAVFTDPSEDGEECAVTSEMCL